MSSGKAAFVTNRTSLVTQLLFYQSYISQACESLPVLIENAADHPVTWKKGNIGYLSVESPTNRKVSPFTPSN